jgi:glycerol-3-phosphate dehydrogenase
MGYAENAYENGVQFFLNTKVEKLEKTGEGFRVQVHHTDNGVDETIETKLIVNAAGVYADEINNQLSDRKLHITARKGEYMLLDKTVGDYVKSTIFQLPSKMGKGVLVTPTVHGNLLVGPTAVNVEDKGAVNTTMNGLDQIARVSSHSVKNVPLRQVITSFAGLRAHEDGDDFVIGESADVKGLINAAGIESPGLSSAPAIGVTVAELVRDLLNAEEKSDFNPEKSEAFLPARPFLLPLYKWLRSFRLPLPPEIQNPQDHAHAVHFHMQRYRPHLFPVNRLRPDLK